jgi:Fur family peroxide stress response transcriptional regulator
MTATLQRWVDATRASGLKLTHQRLEILRELADNREHPDVETLFRAVRARVPTVSLDTVYRTLWTLHGLGLVTTLGARREGLRFDTNLDPHHHFVCVRCGLVRDVVSDTLDATPIPAAVRELGGDLDVHVEFRGVCRACSTPTTQET